MQKKPFVPLDATEFLRRLFLHLLPEGFVRIRRFGLHSNRFRTQRPMLARTLLAMQQGDPVVQPVEQTATGNAPQWHCPKCDPRHFRQPRECLAHSKSTLQDTVPINKSAFEVDSPNPIPPASSIQIP
jgi:hypothetical protein